MIQRVLIIGCIICGALLGHPASAQALPEATKILVTFADSGLQHTARTGPAGPGYRRRSAIYLPSVTVKSAAKRIAADFDLEIVDEWPIVSLNVHCLVYAVADEVAVEELLGQLRERPEVESAQRLQTFRVSAATSASTDDPYVRLQHVVETLELRQAHTWSVGDGAQVAVIDTGADLQHPELRSQVAGHRDFVDGQHERFLGDAHGTAVAGIIVAAPDNGVGTIGIAPAASLSVLKACWYQDDDPIAVCDSFTLAQALGYAIESGVDVINLSLGGPSDALLERLVARAIERGSVVVTAAPAHNDSLFPSTVPGVITVRSQELQTDQERFRRFPISAPGDDILVLAPRGNYDYASGSSLAAAHVSGIVALLIALEPGLDGKRAVSLLAVSQPAVGNSVNACRALAELLGRSGCREDGSLTHSMPRKHPDRASGR